MKTTNARFWSIALLTALAGAFQITQGQATSPEPQQSGDGSNWVYIRPGSLVGKQLPSFEVTGKGGATLTSDSLRGAPVLIDLWATWCAPCEASLPELATYYEQTKCTGLVMVALDQDKVEGKANDYLAKRHYDWPDYHESDEVHQLIGGSGLPRVILVDPGGKVVYDELAFKPDELRAEFAKMGPQFESLASHQSTCHGPNKNSDSGGR
jgi:thiol-disulfide isomerase/thioredoxin